MSNRREQFEGESGLGVVTDWLGQYYHYVTFALLLLFAFWNRARNWQNFIYRGEIIFRGNDPWYHYRSTMYTVKHFPETMPYEVWTQFPIGTSPGQFGTFYDQLMAAMALIVGLGNPSPELVKKVVLISPALFGMLVLVPAYLIGRRVGGRFGGVLAAAVIALAPDQLLIRSVAGFSDHHVAEALFMSLGVLGVIVALDVAQQEKPVYELLLAREWDALRRPFGYGILAGIAISTYLWTWPPGVLLVGIVGVFFLLHLSAEVVRGNSPEHTAIVGAVALVTTGILQLQALVSLDVSATSRTLLQPGLAFAVAFGCVFMAWLFRQWEARDLDNNLYPVAVGGIIVTLAVFMALVLPDLFWYLVDQVLRVVGFQVSPSAGTIGEAQPLRDPYALFYDYRMALFTAVAGALIVVTRQFTDAEAPAGELLLVIWFLFMVAATFTQQRFAYYLAVPVATLTAVAVGAVMRFIPPLERITNVEAYQVMTVLSVILLVLAPMFLTLGSSGIVGVSAMRISDGAGRPSPGTIGWHESLNWLENNTPAPGKYGNPDGQKIDYYGSFGITDDYNYPDGAYGVISWWDYGHWITVEGKRIPVANPFQQQATAAAKFLLAQNESQARDVLQNIDEDDAQTRYVMVDWKMVATETQVGGKYFAPIQFHPNQTRSEFYSRVTTIEQLRQSGFIRGTDVIWRKQPYYNSIVTRLYLYHGSAVEPKPWVLDWRGAVRRLGNGDTFVRPPTDGSTIQRFRTMRAARAFVRNDTTSQIGGFGPYPKERVPALEHYRLVHLDERSATLSGNFMSVISRTINNNRALRRAAQPIINSNRSAQVKRQLLTRLLYPTTPAWTKTFERVPGATIEGSGAPANANVTLSVTMDPANGRPFTYRQRVQANASGEFTATVPYATTGGDEIGVAEGYTNTSVHAVGPYQITAIGNASDATIYTGTVNVTEAQVVGETETAATVTLEATQIGGTDGGTDGSTNGTDGTSSTDGSTDGTGSGTNTETNSTSGGTATNRQLTADTASTRAD